MIAQGGPSAALPMREGRENANHFFLRERPTAMKKKLSLTLGLLGKVIQTSLALLIGH